MVLFLTIVFGLMSVVYGVKTAQELLAADAGSARMQEISGAVAEGAQAYLNRQYKTIGMVGGVIFVMLVVLLGWAVAFGFLIGAALSGAAGYIGMMGSKRKVAEIFQALREEGFSSQELERVYAPIGLSIGAETPEEIAISIAGELIQVRAAGTR
jgi:Na+/H+-translocating membrane pyrophosphatase